MADYSFVKSPVDVDRLRLEVAAAISTTLEAVALGADDEVVLSFDGALTELQVVTLAGVLQDHTGEPLAPYRLSGELDPRTVDYTRAGYYVRRTFSDARNGEVALVEYFASYDADAAQFSDLVVDEAFAYERDQSDLPTLETKTITWYREDDTAGVSVVTERPLAAWEGMQLAISQRRNALDGFRAEAFAQIGTITGDLPDAVDFLQKAEASGNVTYYELGHLDPLIDWVNDSAEPYLTAAAKAALTSKLAGATMQEIDLSPTEYAIKIVRGDDYLNADGRALTFEKQAADKWPANLTGALVELVASYAGAVVGQFPGVVTQAEDPGQAVRVELVAADSATLPAGALKFDVAATLDGKSYTLARGKLTVLADVAVSPGNTLPLPPSGLAAVIGAGDPLTEIDLTWVDESDNETGFKIERRTAAGVWAQIATVLAGVQAYTDDNAGAGLANGTQYYYRVRAYNALGNSAYSGEVNATTDAAPSLLVAAQGAGDPATEIDLTWQSNGAGEDGFSIERKTGAGGVYAQIDTVGEGVEAYTDDNAGAGLANETQYFYRVRAIYGAAYSAYSNEDDATTAAAALGTFTFAPATNPGVPGSLANDNAKTVDVGGDFFLAPINDSGSFDSYFAFEHSGDFTATVAVGAVPADAEDSALIFHIQQMNAAMDAVLAERLLIITGGDTLAAEAVAKGYHLADGPAMTDIILSDATAPAPGAALTVEWNAPTLVVKVGEATIFTDNTFVAEAGYANLVIGLEGSVHGAAVSGTWKGPLTVAAA